MIAYLLGVEPIQSSSTSRKNTVPKVNKYRLLSSWKILKEIGNPIQMAKKYIKWDFLALLPRNQELVWFSRFILFIGSVMSLEFVHFVISVFSP